MQIMRLFGMNTDAFLAGGIGYGTAKADLAAAINDRLNDMRAKYAEIRPDMDMIDRVLASGAGIARETAAVVMAKVKKTIGVIS